MQHRSGMKVHLYRCPACGYESRHVLGTPDMDQTFTDVNTEFAQYRLYVCKSERRLVHQDALGPSFDGRCPSDLSQLEEVPDYGRVACPRCGKSELSVQEAEPLSSASSDGAVRRGSMMAVTKIATKAVVAAACDGAHTYIINIHQALGHLQ